MKDALYFWRENKEMKKQLRPETGEIDADTGLTYHWNRWRNEDGDVFISEDPARDGYNWYGYANANPFRYVDSNGLESYVCRDGTFCNEGDISNPSYRADCYHYNGYNAGTIASMSGYAYSLYNNGGQATLALSWTSVSSPTAAEEIKSYGRTIQSIIAEKNSFVAELILNKEEVEQNIKLFVMGYEFSDNSFDISSIKLSNNPYIIGSNLQTDVEVHVYRPSEGYSNEFDSLRITTVKSKFGTTTYMDKIGANAKDASEGMTLPCGVYNLTNTFVGGGLLTQNEDGSYNSGEKFKDVLRIVCNDPKIPEDIKNIINKTEGDYFLHANQFKGRSIPYNQGKEPAGYGCNITYGGQEMHSIFMDILRMATNLSDINYYIH